MINSSKKLVGPFIIDLKNKFQEIAGDDHLIDRSEFRAGLEISNEEFSDRLFEIFDKDKSGAINISEFMSTIETIINGSELDKIKFAFNLHDLDDSGFIDKAELKILIEQSFLENNLDYDEFQMDLLVDEFFKRSDTDHSGAIDFGEFLDVAYAYPAFISGFAVNPIRWLIPDRFENSNKGKLVKEKNRFSSSIQVQDIGIVQWLLIPRLIFLYNVLINRKKNRTFINLKAIHLLPSKIIELTISKPDGFEFTPGDYVYVNCSEISKIEWYPFNIIRHTSDGNLILHVRSNNRWTKKLYSDTVKGFTQNDKLNWNLRIDGPYGASSNEILQSEHSILVGAGHGISRIAPILQDIAMRSKKEPENITLKRIDLFWLSSDDHYFEWFTKLLNEINFSDADTLFHYHIYFVDRQPENMKEKMMYISTNILKKETDVVLIDNLWGKSSFGIPDWSSELKNLLSKKDLTKSKLFYSGPRNMKGNIQSECKKLDISYHEGNF